MVKNRAHLVKKTIVNKNGITTTVWVRATPKKKDKKKKSSKKDKEVVKVVNATNERNYKTDSTEDLIREAKELGIEWKENQDPRINRMRVIMKLKEYYASNPVATTKPISTKEPEFWKDDIEASKYGNIETTVETQELAREIGILAEDKESQGYLSKIASTLHQNSGPYVEALETFSGMPYSGESASSFIIRTFITKKGMASPICNVGGLFVETGRTVPLDIGCSFQDVSTFLNMNTSTTRIKFSKKDRDSFDFIKNCISLSGRMIREDFEDSLINLYNSPELTKLYKNTLNKDIPRFLVNYIMAENGSINYSPKEIYGLLNNLHRDLDRAIEGLSKKSSILKILSKSQRDSLLAILNGCKKSLTPLEEYKNFMNSKYCNGDDWSSDMEKYLNDVDEYDQALEQAIEKVKNGHASGNKEDTLKYATTLALIKGDLGFSSSKDLFSFIQKSQEYFISEGKKGTSKFFEKVLNELPIDDVYKRETLEKIKYGDQHLGIPSKLNKFLGSKLEGAKITKARQTAIKQALGLANATFATAPVSLVGSLAEVLNDSKFLGINIPCDTETNATLLNIFLKLKDKGEPRAGYQWLHSISRELSKYTISKDFEVLVNKLGENYPELQKKYNKIKNLSEETRMIFMTILDRLKTSPSTPINTSIKKFARDQLATLTYETNSSAVFDRIQDNLIGNFSGDKKVIKDIISTTKQKIDERVKILEKIITSDNLDIKLTPGENTNRISYVSSDPDSKTSKELGEFISFYNECVQCYSDILTNGETDSRAQIRSYNTWRINSSNIGEYEKQYKHTEKLITETISKDNLIASVDVADWLSPEEKELGKSLVEEFYKTSVTNNLSDVSSNKDIKCSVRMATKSEYDKVVQDIKTSFDHKEHGGIKYKVKGVYKINNLDVRGSLQEIIERRAERKASGISFETSGSAKDPVQDTFYHGTSHTTLGKILGETGKFRVPKNNEVVTGSMMGLGIYLADCSSKSMQYCGAGFRQSNSDGTKGGALIVCTASVGDCADFRTATDSSITTYGDKKKHGLRNNEWCVKDENAVAPEFIVDIEIL